LLSKYPVDFNDRDADMSVPVDRHRTTFAWGLSSFLERPILAPFPVQTIVRVTRLFGTINGPHGK